MIILAGDIGGTKTWLQIAKYSFVPPSECLPINECFEVLFEQRYVSTQYASFENLLREFFNAADQENTPLPVAACIGVAGPVKENPEGYEIASVTNLPWKLDAHQLAECYQLKRCRLINDFQAIAFGLEMLANDEVVQLQKGDESAVSMKAPKIVIGAGTGLGQALLVWNGVNNDSHNNEPNGGHYVVVPSEGGHGNFAPASVEQGELYSFLSAKQARVSVEDVLSGRGLVNIYQFLADKYPDDVSEALSHAMDEGDSAAAVSNAGLSQSDSLAAQALKMFVEIYGAQAGNFALACMATGGVYISGGIAAKVKDCFTFDTFLSAFHDKGPMQEIMKTIPVNLVLNPQVGLKGAALVASRL